jgi:nitrogen-specific signal transduction histidine kinase
MINLKEIIQNLPSAIIVVNRDRRIMLSNWVAQKFSGLSESQIANKRGGNILGCRHAEENELGCGFSSHCHLCEAKLAVEKAFEEKNHVRPFETEIKIRDIGPRFFKMTTTYLCGALDIPGDDGAVTVVTIDDVTDFKIKERLTAAHETIGAVCHEMNQPLMALMGYIDILTADPTDLTLLPEILAQAERMSSITRKMQSLTCYVTKKYLGGGSRILDIASSAQKVKEKTYD